MASKKPKPTLEDRVKSHLETSMKVFGPNPPIDYKPPRAQARNRIFVYGTLRKGFDNHAHYLAKAKDTMLLGEQKLHGFEVHCNPAMLIPVMIKRDGASCIGEVYEVSKATLQSIRHLEGSYQEIEVETVYGKAFAYCNSRPWNDNTEKECPAVPDGNYTAWASEKVKALKLRRLKDDFKYYSEVAKDYAERAEKLLKELKDAGVEI